MISFIAFANSVFRSTSFGGIANVGVEAAKVVLIEKRKVQIFDPPKLLYEFGVDTIKSTSLSFNSFPESLLL